jgi:DNA-binding transcriptional ArsR family regulator
MVKSSVVDLDRIFVALASPTRRAILRRVARRPGSVGDLAQPFEMSLAAVSKHVKMLEEAGLLRRRKEGSFSYLSLNAEALRPADEWIAFYRQFWKGRLATLKQILEKEES